MVTAKESHALVSYFMKAYKSKYGFEPVVNRYKARYGMESILFDHSMQEAEALVDYYFTTPSPNNHNIEYLFYNYDKMVLSMKSKQVDDARQAEIRQQTKERTERWIERVGKDSG